MLLAAQLTIEAMKTNSNKVLLVDWLFSLINPNCQLADDNYDSVISDGDALSRLISSIN